MFTVMYTFRYQHLLCHVFVGYPICLYVFTYVYVVGVVNKIKSIQSCLVPALSLDNELFISNLSKVYAFRVIKLYSKITAQNTTCTGSRITAYLSINQRKSNFRLGNIKTSLDSTKFSGNVYVYYCHLVDKSSFYHKHTIKFKPSWTLILILIILTTNLAECVCVCAKCDPFLPLRFHFFFKLPEFFFRIAKFPYAAFGPLFAFHCPIFFTKNNTLNGVCMLNVTAAH